MTPRRVVVLTPQWLGMDGVSSYTRTVLVALAGLLGASEREVWSLHETGAEPLPACGDGWKARWAAGSKAKLSAWAASAGLRSQADTFVLIVHLGLTPLALPFSLRGARCGAMLHGVEAWRPIAGLDASALRRCRLAANSQYTARRFVEINPAFASQSIGITPLCMDGAADSSGPCAPTTEDFALIVGRMSAAEKYKGHEQLIAAWPTVRAAAPQAQLWIAGDGDDRPRLEALAASVGLANGVRFLGRVSNERLAELYRQCRCFAMPSVGEGFGLVYLEAMRAGKPCVACPGAAEEIVLHEETGFIAPQEPAALAERLVQMFRDDDLCQRLGAAGKRREAEVFAPANFAAATFRAFGLAGAAP